MEGKGCFEFVVWFFLCFLIMRIASTCRALWRAEIRSESRGGVSSRRESGRSGTVRPIQDHSSTAFSRGHCQLAPHPEAGLPEIRQVLRWSDGQRCGPKTSVPYIETLLSGRPNRVEFWVSGSFPVSYLICSLSMEYLAGSGGPAAVMFAFWWELFQAVLGL